MRSSQTIISGIHLVLVFLILGVGLLLVSMPWAPIFCYLFANLFIYSPEILFAGGVFFLLIGLLMLFGFYAIYKQRYIRIVMSPFPFEIDPLLINKYLDEYFTKTFSDKTYHAEATVTPDHKLEINLQTPMMEKDEIDPFLEKIEKEIGELLHTQFSYKKEFILNWAVQR